MNLNLRKALIIGVLLSFLANSFGPAPMAEADEFRLPAPGVMVRLSPEFAPPILKGIKVHPDNPFRFDFILDKGDAELSNIQLRDESSKLIKYFLASLTIPENDLWVNLSPYEKDRIIPQSFGLTEMGRDLLAEDYMLKQITASLIYPEGGIGKRFWKRVYEIAQKRYGTTNISVNTFNKVWIVPEKAVVYENAKSGTAYVVENKLKVMLEGDYLSLEKHEGIQSEQAQNKGTNQLGSQIVREIVIPELTKEVNENKNFAQLRQVYNSLILAVWYKKKIKDSILEQVYADKNKVTGINIDDPNEKDKIYQRYLQAFKKGVYNYIKEDIDSGTQETIPRKYFSGGVRFTDFAQMSLQTTIHIDKAMLGNANKDVTVSARLDSSLGSSIKEMTENDLRDQLRRTVDVNVAIASIVQGLGEPKVQGRSMNSLDVLGKAKLITAESIPENYLKVWLASLKEKESALYLPERISINPSRAEEVIAGLRNLDYSLRGRDRELIGLAEEHFITAKQIPADILKALMVDISNPDLIKRHISLKKLILLAQYHLISQERVAPIVEVFITHLSDLDATTRQSSAEGLEAFAKDHFVKSDQIPADSLSKLIVRLSNSDGGYVGRMDVEALEALARGGLIIAENVGMRDFEERFLEIDHSGLPRDIKILLATAYYTDPKKRFSPSRLKSRLEFLFMTLNDHNLTRANMERLVNLANKGDVETMRQWVSEWLRVGNPMGNMSLDYIRFYDGGTADANFNEFVPKAFRFLGDKFPTRPQGLPQKGSKVSPIMIQDGRHFQVGDISIDLTHPAKQYGRTLVYYPKGRRKGIYLKFLKKGEDVANLPYECDLMNFFNDRKEEWGLQGRYPRGRLRLGEIAASQMPFLKSEIESEGKSSTLALNSDGKYTFMVYETDLTVPGQDDYMTYLNDPDLSHKEFMEGLRFNVHDRFIMARHGLFDLEIIELFHSKDSARHYDWSVDLYMKKNGIGRLDNVTGATLYPNIRKSGPADFPEIYYIGDLMRYRESNIVTGSRVSHLLNIMGDKEVNILPYLTATYCGDIQLALGLMIPTYLLRRQELDYKHESKNKDSFLQQALTMLFREGFEAYAGQGSGRNIQALNIQLLARQMGYFMTDRYFLDYQTSKRIPANLYPGTRMDPIEAGRGWNNQRGWDLERKMYKIPSRNPNLNLKMSSFDLGPVNGPNPLQEFFKALFYVTPLMIVGASQDKSQLSNKEIKSGRDLGGIDLSPTNIDLQSRSSDGEIKFRMDPAILARLQKAPGFVPVIINIQPLKSLSAFLGVNQLQS